MLAAACCASTCRTKGKRRCCSKYHSSRSSSCCEKGSLMVMGYSPLSSKATMAFEPSASAGCSRICISAMPVPPYNLSRSVHLLFFSCDHEQVSTIGLIQLHELCTFVHALFGQYLFDKVVDGVGGNADAHVAQ